jgi:predicted dehydrogenase
MRVGIVGAGMIVPNFLDAASLLDYEFIAISGLPSDESAMDEFSAKYGITKKYFDYDLLL